MATRPWMFHQLSTLIHMSTEEIIHFPGTMPNQPHGCVAKKKADMVELRKRTKDKGTQAGEGCQKGFKAFCGWPSGKISAGEGGWAKRNPRGPFPLKKSLQGGK